MKTKITVAKFSDLASETVKVKHPASVPAVPELSSHPKSEDSAADDRFREMENRRYSIPFAYDHWGLNE